MDDYRDEIEFAFKLPERYKQALIPGSNDWVTSPDFFTPFKEEAAILGKSIDEINWGEYVLSTTGTGGILFEKALLSLYKQTSPDKEKWENDPNYFKPFMEEAKRLGKSAAEVNWGDYILKNGILFKRAHLSLYKQAAGDDYSWENNPEFFKPFEEEAKRLGKSVEEINWDDYTLKNEMLFEKALLCKSMSIYLYYFFKKKIPFQKVRIFDVKDLHIDHYEEKLCWRVNSSFLDRFNQSQSSMNIYLLFAGWEIILSEGPVKFFEDIYKEPLNIKPEVLDVVDSKVSTKKGQLNADITKLMNEVADQMKDQFIDTLSSFGKKFGFGKKK